LLEGWGSELPDGAERSYYNAAVADSMIGNDADEITVVHDSE
jgi:hypothetical protein